MDYAAYCQTYFEAVRIPITLMKDQAPVYSALAELLGMNAPEEKWTLYPAEHNPSFETLSPDIEYGRVKVEGTGYDIILGPVFSMPPTPELVSAFIHEQALPLELREQLMEIFCSMPVITHLQLARHMALIHLTVNGQKVDESIFYDPGHAFSRELNEDLEKSRMEIMEEGDLHNSYQFEMEMFQYIQDGNTASLTRHLQSRSGGIREGKMAATPLRQAKNVLITAAAKIAMLGAIPGGVDVEQAYQLMEHYIRECERLVNIREVKTLQHAMVMDFCRRSEEARIPEGISPEVYQCMNFIRSHTNEKITISDVADHISRSPSHVMKKFREELGFHAGAYITRCKLEEARSLLTHTDMSLAEISSYLCFSSQSYFQTLFKKQYGVTPLQYRKDGLKNENKQSEGQIKK